VQYYEKGQLASHPRSAPYRLAPQKEIPITYQFTASCGHSGGCALQ
jgi:hypothetical protein